MHTVRSSEVRKFCICIAAELISYYLILLSRYFYILHLIHVGLICIFALVSSISAKMFVIP